jgi:hypothetical protein
MMLWGQWPGGSVTAGADPEEPSRERHQMSRPARAQTHKDPGPNT